MVAVELKVVEEGEEFKMKIQQLKSDKEKVVLKFSGVNTTFANMLRREVLESVPTMAIEDVEFRDNSSALYDEVLAHRLGLIPLKTDLKSYVIPDQCKCKGEGCARCQLKLTVKVKGPCNVYASDIKSKDPKVKPVFPKTLIVKLLKDQLVEAEMTCILGRGDDHIKFAPGLVFYHNVSEFKQSKKIENAEEVVKKCPAGVFKAEAGKLIPLDDTKSYLWDSCLELVPEDSVIITEKEDEIIFTLEPWGQLSAKEILVTAAEGFIEQLDEFEKIFK
jgi:DNA-directed RNA polymerase subunit D